MAGAGGSPWTLHPMAENPLRHYFRERRSAVAADATYNEVEFTPLQEGRIYHVERYAVEDETSALTGDVRVYVKGHGYEHWLTEEDTVAEATLYWESDPTLLLPGESLVARFTGTTENDVLRLYIEGWWEELEGRGE